MLLGPRRQADLICSYYDMDVISCNFCFLFWSYLIDGASSCCILVLLISVWLCIIVLARRGVAYGVIWKCHLLVVLLWIPLLTLVLSMLVR